MGKNIVHRIQYTTKKIGLFDSGLGGISILNVMLSLPIEEFVYVADTAHLPYGEKSVAYLHDRAQKIMQYFKDQGIYTVVIACHTSSVTSYDFLKTTFPEITFIDPLPWTIEDALKVTKNDRIGILATERSISTHVHKNMLLSQNKNLCIAEQACPLLVPLLENGGTQQEKENALALYTQVLQKAEVDTVILGCTHYAFLQQEIQVFLPTVTCISAASSMQKRIDFLESVLSKKVCFVVSGNVDQFKITAQNYLVGDVDVAWRKLP